MSLYPKFLKTFLLTLGSNAKNGHELLGFALKHAKEKWDHFPISPTVWSLSWRWEARHYSFKDRGKLSEVDRMKFAWKAQYIYTHIYIYIISISKASLWNSTCFLSLPCLLLASFKAVSPLTCLWIDLFRIRSQSALPPSTPVQESQWHGTSKPLKDAWSGYQGDKHQSVFPFCLNFDQPCVWKIVKVRTVRRNSNPRGSQAPGSKCSKGCCIMLIMLYQRSHRDDVTRSQRDLRSFWHQQDRAGIRSESDIVLTFTDIVKLCCCWRLKIIFTEFKTDDGADLSSLGHFLPPAECELEIWRLAKTTHRCWNGFRCLRRV